MDTIKNMSAMMIIETAFKDNEFIQRGGGGVLVWIQRDAPIAAVNEHDDPK
jgi:hypothetical protein